MFFTTKSVTILGFLALATACGSDTSLANTDAHTASNTSSNAMNISIDGGKKVFIDGKYIRPSAGGSTVLYIDDDIIRDAPGGTRLLYLDNDDVRPEPGGVRLAYWDGNTLRRTPGGTILLRLDGYDIRNAQGEKMVSLEAGNYSQIQITAALYYLNPAIFKPSDADMAAAKAAIAEGQAWDAQQATAENENGSYELITSSGSYQGLGKCDLKWTGDHYAMTFANNGMSGVAIKRDDSGYRLTGAMGKGSYTTGIFKHKNGAYHGSWYNNPKTGAIGNDQISANPNEVSSLQSSTAGTLSFTKTQQQLNYQGVMYDVSSSKGMKGKAYEIGNEANGYVLVVVLGDEFALIDAELNGGFVGDYAGNKAAGYLNYIK